MGGVIKSDFGIYKVLETHIQAAGKKPLTCVDLFDRPDVKKFAKDANKVSDYLGHMWRRGLLERYPAPKTSTSFARWAYTWKTDQHHDDSPLKAVPSPVNRRAPPNIDIDEETGAVTISCPDFIVTVRSKRNI